MMLADIMFRSNEFDEAIRYFAQMLEHTPNNYKVPPSLSLSLSLSLPVSARAIIEVVDSTTVKVCVYSNACICVYVYVYVCVCMHADIYIYCVYVRMPHKGLIPCMHRR